MSETYDVALIGGGIMSSTLGTMLHRLQPDWRIRVVERLGHLGVESSNPWNNAGTGHSALCELNYTPEKADGSIDISKAVSINEQFQKSREFWSSLVADGAIPDPSAFINPVPHMSFVWGEENVEYLRKRYEALKDHPLFGGMEFSTDARQIRAWAPAMIPGRLKSQHIAATRTPQGTDVDFGSLNELLMDSLTEDGIELDMDTSVIGLKRRRDGVWRVRTKYAIGEVRDEFTARFVFVGAGGGALNLLQKSGIREIRGYGGFPISGQFLRCDVPEIVAKHDAKVYGKAEGSAPPMSVPHLDTRVVGGTKSLLFGPYAGFSTKYLKTGSLLDLFAALRWHNLGTFIGAGLKNLDLVSYLVGQVVAGRDARMRELRKFMPEARDEDWYLISAGQRVQIMKRDADGSPIIPLGTEVISGAEGTIAGLLGASPGASTAVPIMLDVIAKCFPDRLPAWEQELRRMIPSYGTSLGEDPAAAQASLERTAEVLHLPAPARPAHPDSARPSSAAAARKVPVS